MIFDSYYLTQGVIAVYSGLGAGTAAVVVGDSFYFTLNMITSLSVRSHVRTRLNARLEIRTELDIRSETENA